MTNRIQLKRSGNVSSIPSDADLDYGELALNYTDGVLYFKSNANVVTTLANAYSVNVTGNITGGNLRSASLGSAGNTVLVGPDNNLISTSRLYINTDNGRIGIGTISPDYPFELETTGENALIVLTRTDGAACFIEGQANRAAFGAVGATPLALAYDSLAVVTIGAGGAITVNPDGGSPFTFPTADGSANNVLVTDGTGNVNWTGTPTFDEVRTNVVGNNNGTSITIVGDFLPAENEAYSLGSDSLRWKDMHLAGNTIYIGGIPISALAGAVQIQNFQTTNFELNSVTIAADSGTGAISVNNQEVITTQSFQQLPTVVLAEAQNRHQVYKIAAFDNTNYSGIGITTIAQVADLYQQANSITANAAIYINDFQAIYEFYPNANNTTLLTNVFAGLSVINNQDDIHYKWDSTSNEWVEFTSLNINGNAIITNLNITSNLTITDTFNGNIIRSDFVVLTSDITAGNASLSGELNAGGNITANYYFGNAAFLDGLETIYGNANVEALLGNLESNIISTANISTNASITSNANITAFSNVNATRGNFTFLSVRNNVLTSLVPNANTVSNIGSVTNRWGNAWFGNTSLGNLIVTGISESYNYQTGAIVAGGGISAGGNLNVNGNAFIGGNLTVFGNTITLDSNVLVINDRNIIIGNNYSDSQGLDGAGINIGNPTLTFIRWRHDQQDLHTNSAYTIEGNINGNANLNILGNAIFSGNITANNLATKEEFDRRTLWMSLTTSFVTNPTPGRSGDPENIDTNATGTIDGTSVTGNVFVYYTEREIAGFLPENSEYFRLVPNPYNTKYDSYWETYAANVVSGNLLATRS